ncbi:hypothetical protein MYAM1_001584 [Malassezia yamatoensis]|uniref:Uncharacterized protein n=1 Tax=Malassezia yamatoensis TaxID=253288 RepID=A0AAJ5YS44_9BASI|nr:hypothetical protein MYAM1_001584 [Malassezia yamatoensis]
MTYGAETDTNLSANLVQPYMPRTISSAVDNQWDPESPTPPLLAEITTASDTPDVLGCFEQTMLGAVWMRPMCRTKLHNWPSVQIQWHASAYHKAQQACEYEDPGPFGDTEMTPVDYRSLYKGMLNLAHLATMSGSNGLDSTEYWPTRAQEHLARLEKQIPLSTTSATSLLDAMMRFDSKTNNSSQIHCKHTVCNVDANNAAIGRILAHAQKQDAHDYLAMAIPWCDDIPQDKKLLWDWILKQLAKANPGTHQKAIAQQAIDLLLASIVLPNVIPPQDEAQNANWRWDRKEAPSFPNLATPSFISSSSRSEQLPDTTRILMAEWPVGSDPNSYQYENPYLASFEPVDHVLKGPSASSQPIKEVVRSSKKRPHDLPSQPISLRQSRSSSQADDHPSSSQNLGSVPAIAQTQMEPGRFGTRGSIQPAKRKKRTSGF